MSSPLICASDVGKTFNARDGAVLEGINLDVHGASSIAITGPSGSGKTTLLSILGGLMPPDQGQVLFHPSGGPTTANLSHRNRAAFLGYVFQHPHLVPTLTAVENVELPLIGAGIARAEREARAATLIERFNLAQVAKRLPAKLSGGERQRVALARAFELDPQVILADEPTGNLDGAMAEHVADALVGTTRQQGGALVLVTHDDKLASRMDRRFVLRDKQLLPTDPETGKVA